MSMTVLSSSFSHSRSDVPESFMQLDATQRAARDQFSRQSDKYGRGHVLEQIEDLRKALPWLRLPESGQVLDVATGGGHTGVFFATLGYHVTVNDLAQPMLDRALELARERGVQIETRLHPAEAMPYDPDTFDLVTCRIAAHHFTSPALFVQEVSKVLRPGGQFLLIDGTVDDDQPVAEEWAHQVEKLRDPSHNRLLPPAEWRRLCAEAGLEVDHWMITPFKQPDLQWYFEVASTPQANRTEVLRLVREAPPAAVQLFQVGEEKGKTIWWWRRLTLVARKPSCT